MERIRRSRLDSADFLLLEARTAVPYLDLAERSHDREVVRRGLERARRALTAMTYYLDEAAVDEEESSTIRSVRDELRARLVALTR